ncbi:MAG: response regulator receiver protein [Frankiales bacterium]|nr:response regulator receiver protein [Frankiales bacterium]
MAAEAFVPDDEAMAQRVLVVDDDPTVSEVVARYLEHAGYVVDTVADGRVALDKALADPPDLVVLDLMLPGLDGLEVFRQLREKAPVPVVMLTALGEEADRLVGLELGADDYVTKPFSPRELVLRVQSVLRRTSAPLVAGPPQVLSDCGLTVDVGAHEVTLDGAVLSLTVREYDLLVFLMQHPRQAFSREELLRQVWGWEYADHSTVTVHVRRLREKIEADTQHPTRVVTVFGVGYRYEPQDA